MVAWRKGLSPHAFWTCVAWGLGLEPAGQALARQGDAERLAGNGRSLWKIWKARCEHPCERRRIPDLLGGHPLLGLALKLAPGRVALQRADSASGDGGVQLHVGAVESIGGVMEVTQR